MLTRLCLLAFVTLVPSGAAAQLYHRIDAHFGVVATTNAASGATTSQPLVGTSLTLGWQNQLDNGVRIQLEVELDIRNSPRPDAPRTHGQPRGTATFSFR